MRLVAGLMAFLLMGASCKVKEDSSKLTAREGGDLTVIFSTDGEGHRRGLAHVILSDQSVPNQDVDLILPKVKCDLSSCREVFLISLDGTPRSLGDTDSIPISELVGDEVDESDSGPRRVLVSIRQEIGGGMLLRSMVGVIYVTVLKKGYASLGCNSGDVAYTVGLTNGYEAQYSTKLRSVLCGGN